MKKSIFFLSALLLLLCACGGDDANQKASFMLSEARFALSCKQYSQARDSILALRQKYPTAIQVRKQAILLLDSIEMAVAADSLQYVQGEEWERLHIKQQFFERKLLEDKKKGAE
ncbi:MAG: hypothetical protein J6W52_09605 [Bacteroidaceae bacterium]|nr:hypothetical protein [Bacteroidaceae bacterium]